MRQSTLSEHSSDAVCPTCGDTFDSEHGVSAHHWQAHGEKLRIDVECDNCGSTVTKRKCDIYDTNFCDSECMYKYQSGESHPNANHQTRSCETCGEPVTRCEAHHQVRVFCSRDCYGHWLSENWSGVDHPAANGEVKACEECGADVYRAHYKLDGRNHFCSPECRNKHAKRDTAPASLVTAVRRRLSDKTWTAVADSCRAESDGICEMCGISDEQFDQKHDIHHIVPVVAGGVNESELLMELCRSCHHNAERFIRQYPEFDPVLVE